MMMMTGRSMRSTVTRLCSSRPSEVRQTHVEHQTARDERPRSCEKSCAEAKRLDAPARLAEQELERLTDRNIVIDDENDRRNGGHEARSRMEQQQVAALVCTPPFGTSTTRPPVRSR